MFTMKDSESLRSGLGIRLKEVGNMNMKQSGAFDPMNEFHSTLEDRNPEPSLSFDDALRDGLAQMYRHDPPHEEETHHIVTNDAPMECTSEDIGSMTFCPVNDGHVVEMFGSDEPFFGLNGPQEPDAGIGGHHGQPEAVVNYDTPIANYYNVAKPECHSEEKSRCDGFLPFHEINETNYNVKRETVQDAQASVTVAPVATRCVPATRATTTATRTVSPSLQHSFEDYSAEWAQPHGSGNLDFFVETIPQPNGAQTVSVPNLGLLDQHVVIKTQLGLAVLLNCEKKSTSNPHAEENPSLKQPTSTNILGAYQSNLGMPSNRKFQRWSPEEDNLLKQAVVIEVSNGKINWKRIASKYFGNERTSLQCKSRWTKSLRPGINRGAWTQEEDDLILKHQQEGMTFSQIAKFLSGRLPEHVSERFGNVLDPTLKKSAWTREEDEILFQEQRRLGNKWTQISHLIPGRSENSVKNRWHNLRVTRERKMRNQVKEFQREVALLTEEAQPFPVESGAIVNADVGISPVPFPV